MKGEFGLKNDHILMVEDDQRLGELQRDYMTTNGFIVHWLTHGRDIVDEMNQFQPALIVLDLGLPGISGLDICREIRAQYPGKILILTSSEDDFDQVACLEMGADDFVGKPINPRVLLARIRMLLRREDAPQPHVENQKSDRRIEFGGLKLTNVVQEVLLGGERVKLSNAEFKLLWMLASQPDQVLTREALFKELRGIDFDGLDRSVDTKVVALRKKLGDDAHAPRRIITVRNKGYLFSSSSW